VRARPDAARAQDTKGRRWADLRLRVASAAVLVTISLVCWWAGGLAWRALLLLAVVGMLVEWGRLCRRLPRHSALPSLVAGGMCIALAAVSLAWLRADPATGRRATLFLLAAVWASDIGAYAAGRLLGGPRLAPAISPAKTWAGALGGLSASALAGLAIGATGWSAAIGALLSVAAQLGDLLESWLKRAARIKDSGALIPGHGGLLDRLDGLVAAAPVAVGLAMLAGRGIMFWR
jgi:phosphatidate cytidylyltransferase